MPDLSAVDLSGRISDAAGAVSKKLRQRKKNLAPKDVQDTSISDGLNLIDGSGRQAYQDDLAGLDGDEQRRAAAIASARGQGASIEMEREKESDELEEQERYEEKQVADEAAVEEPENDIEATVRQRKLSQGLLIRKEYEFATLAGGLGVAVKQTRDRTDDKEYDRVKGLIPDITERDITDDIDRLAKTVEETLER